MLNPGKYLAYSKGAALEQAKTGTWQVSVQFEICSADAAGESIVWYGYLTEKARDRTIATLRLIGWTGLDFTDLTELANEGLPVVELVVEHEQYNGKLSAKVKWVNEEGGGPKAVTSDAAAAFARELRGAVMAHDKAHGAPKSRPKPKPAPVPPANDAPPPGDDDIQF